MEKKNVKRYFFFHKKVFGIFSLRKEVFSVFISYKGGAIEIGNMYQQYLTDKKIGKYKNLDLLYEDIVALGDYLSNELGLPVSEQDDETLIDWNIALLNAFIESGKLSYKKEIKDDLMEIIKPGLYRLSYNK